MDKNNISIKIKCVLCPYGFETLVLRPNCSENYEHTRAGSQTKVIIYLLNGVESCIFLSVLFIYCNEQDIIENVIYLY